MSTTKNSEDTLTTSNNNNNNSNTSKRLSMEIERTENGYLLGGVEMHYKPTSAQSLNAPRNQAYEEMLKLNAPMLSETLTTGSNDKRHQVLLMLNNFYSHSRPLLVELIGVSAFIEVLRSGTLALQIIALNILAEGLTNSKIRLAFVQAHGLPLLVSLLDTTQSSPSAPPSSAIQTTTSTTTSTASTNSSAPRAATPTLSPVSCANMVARVFLQLTLYTNEHNHAIYEAHAIPKLVRYAALGTQGCVEALYVLAKLSHETPACKIAIVNADGVRVVLDLLRVREPHTDVARYRHAAYALYNLVYENTRAATQVIPDIQVITSMIDYPDAETNMWARRTLAYIASSSLTHLAQSEHVSAGLVKCLLRPPVESIILSAVCAHAWDNEAHRHELGAMGAIPPLVAILRKLQTEEHGKGKEKKEDEDQDEGEERALTTRALWFITLGNEDNQEIAVDEGLIPLLVEQLRELKAVDTEECSDTIATLGVLLGKPRYSNTFVELGGLALFAEIIKNTRTHTHSDAEKAEVLDALHTLAFHNRAHLATVAADLSVMLSLAMFLRKGSSRAQAAVKRLVILIAGEGLNVHSSICPTLISAFAADVKEEKPIAQAVVVLLRIAEDNLKHCELITAEGVIPHVVRLAQTGSGQEQYVSAKLLLVLYRISNAIREFCEESRILCVLRLMRFYDTLNPDTRMRITEFIRDMTMYELRTREVIVRADAVGFLLTQVAQGTSEEQRESLKILCNLTLMGHEQLKSHNGGEVLVEYIKRQEDKDSHNARRAVRALWATALAPSHREWISELLSRGQWSAIAGGSLDYRALAFLLEGQDMKHHQSTSENDCAEIVPSVPSTSSVPVDIEQKHSILLESMYEMIHTQLWDTKMSVLSFDVVLHLLNKFLKGLPGTFISRQTHTKGLQLLLLVFAQGEEILLSPALSILHWFLLSGIPPSHELSYICSIISALEYHPNQKVSKSAAACVRFSAIQYPNMETVARKIRNMEEQLTAVKQQLSAISKPKEPEPPKVDSPAKHKKKEANTKQPSPLKNENVLGENLYLMTMQNLSMQQRLEEDQGQLSSKQREIDKHKKEALALKQEVIRLRSLAGLPQLPPEQLLNAQPQSSRPQSPQSPVPPPSQSLSTQPQSSSPPKLTQLPPSPLQQVHQLPQTTQPSLQELQQIVLSLDELSLQELNVQIQQKLQPQLSIPVPELPNGHIEQTHQTTSLHPQPLQAQLPQSPLPSPLTKKKKKKRPKSKPAPPAPLPPIEPEPRSPTPPPLPPNPDLIDLSSIDSIGHLAEIELLEGKLEEKLTQVKQRKGVLQKREFEKLKELLLCPICMEKTKNTSLHPCGHLMCGDCAKAIMHVGSTQRCPICRTSVQSANQVYL